MEVLPPTKNEKKVTQEIIQDQHDEVIKTNNSINSKNEKLHKKSTKVEIDENINFEKLVDIVFNETVSNVKRNYIDYDEFSKVMWTTTIDKSCVIHFDDLKYK